MTHIRIGFFRDFKSVDALLIDGDTAGMERLARDLQPLAVRTSERIPLHELPYVVMHQGLRVVAFTSKASSGARLDGDGRIDWTLSTDDWEDAIDKLRTLTDQKPGHQYLDPPTDQVTVIASSGEYGEAFWRREG